MKKFLFLANSSHLEWRVGLSDTILKGTHLGTIPARFGLIWFSSFREKDLNVIFYQNMPNLHNRYKSTERKISQKNPEHMLNEVWLCLDANTEVPQTTPISEFRALLGSLLSEVIEFERRAKNNLCTCFFCKPHPYLDPF